MKKVMNIPFSPPDITEAEIKEVGEALRSGWITTGPRTKELEKRISEYIGTSKAVCLNSATACMELALRVLGIGLGDEVIVPAYTYTASAAVIDHVGAKIVMIDSQEDSFEMDYDLMEEAINQRTKAIIPVDIGGRIADYGRILKAVENKAHLFNPANEIQKAYGRVIILSDSAHGFGAEKDGIKSGCFADLTSFSFHAVKNFTTAEGGALVWKDREGINNESLYKEFMLASLHGQSKDALAKTQVGAWEYDILYPAYKCNMTDILAAIGLVQLDRYPELLKRRKEIIEKYDKAFVPMGLKPLFHYEEGHMSSGHLYLLRIPGIGESERNRIITKMGEKGVATNVHYKPLPMMTAYKNMGFDIKDYPRAFSLYEKEISLPLYSKLTDEEVEYIIDTLIETIGEVRKN